MVWATHLLGGEINYQYLNANGPGNAPYRYRINAVVYFNKDVGSAAPDGVPSIMVSFFDKTQPNAAPRRMGCERISFTEITPTSAGGCTNAIPRVTLARYSGIVNLPASSQGYLAVYSEGARNLDISNLIAPGAMSMALSMSMPPVPLLNSSPVFSDEAVSLICLGDTSTLLNNAYDADGDRLVYAFATPSSFISLGMVVPVTYEQGYSATQPFGASGYSQLNANTGLARYVARQQGRYVLAVDVSEYRRINGQEVLLGTTRRDIQLIVQACPGAPPRPPAFTAATLAARNFTVTEGQPLAFTIEATDPGANPLHMRVVSTLLDGPGATDATVNNNPGTPGNGNAAGSVTLTGLASINGAFRFVPGCGMAREAPYDVVVTVTTNACAGKTIAEVFRIRVLSTMTAPTRVRGDSVLCALATARYTAEGAVALAYRWRVRGGTLVGNATGRTVQVQWGSSSGGSISAQALSALGCPTDSAGVAVRLQPGPAIEGTTAYCPKGNAGLRFRVPDAGGALYRWTVSNGTIVSGQGTAEVVVDVVRGASATLRVINTTSNSCPGEVLIRPDEFCLAFYNVMTPNQDGLNDAFVIENIERYPGNQLTIYNRWGRQLYRATDYHNTWQGDAQPAGTYYYLCQLPDGKIYKGWFELLR
ncbi:hypothetical protein B0919_07565 [Hymenobacter sp. CRA2]|nr:hypothetical protein B0919_07565 [Hymenobacter sp. CRA2]